MKTALITLRKKMKKLFIVIVVLTAELCFGQVSNEVLFEYESQKFRFYDIEKAGDNYWVVGNQSFYNGLLLHSNEYDKNWEQLFIDTLTLEYYPQFGFKKIQAFEDGLVYIGSNWGRIFKSNDYGKTLDTIEFDINCEMADFIMLNKDTGFVNFQNDWEFSVKQFPECFTQSIYLTYDGWETYQKVNIPEESKDWYLVRFEKINRNTIYILSYYYKELDNGGVRYYFNLLKSFDAGQNWAIQPLTYNLRDISFINENIGAGVFLYNLFDGEEPQNRIFFTEDGGKNWSESEKKFESFGKFMNIKSFYDSIMVVIGSYYNFNISKDHGKTWENIDLPLPDNLTWSAIMDVEAINGHTFLAIDQVVNYILKIDLLTSSVEVIHGPKTPGIYVENGRGSVTTNLNLSDLSVSLYTLEGQKINLRNINATSSGIEFSLPHSISPGAYVMELASGDKKEFYRILHSGF